MNWGTKLAVMMAIFMSFIIGMVIYMFKVHGDDALIEDNYYEKGINYNAEYDAKQNVINDDVAPTIKIAEQQLILTMKAPTKYSLTMLRPSAADKDKKQEGNTVGEANLIIVSTTEMDKGLWLLNLSWELNGKKYLYKKDITL